MYKISIEDLFHLYNLGYLAGKGLVEPMNQDELIKYVSGNENDIRTNRK